MKTLKTLALIAAINFILILGVALLSGFNLPKSGLPMNDGSNNAAQTSNAGNKPDPADGGAAQNRNACIVTIDGAEYDVTQFRNLHPGGDIFQCGTDMSAIFHNQHGPRELQQMEQYRVSS